MDLLIRREQRKDEKNKYLFVLRYKIEFSEDEKRLLEEYQLWNDPITTVDQRTLELSARFISSDWMTESDCDVVAIAERIVNIHSDCDLFRSRLDAVRSWNGEETIQV
jgi:hypothetical protein